LQAIRAHCLDCCAYQEREVALCPAVKCPSWPFRMGTDPWRKPASEARREAARRTMAALNARRNRGGTEPPPTAPEHGTEPSPEREPTVAPTWATGRVDQVQDTVMHRANGADGKSYDEELRVTILLPKSEGAEQHENSLMEGA
jgi:hypothetical protein